MTDALAADPSDGSELVVAEREVEAALGPATAAALATVRGRWAFADDDVDLSPEYRALGADPAYVRHAEHVVRRAAARARDVQTGVVPYVADRAFTPGEARVVERAAATGLWLDAPWLDAAAALLADVVVAPGTARTLPSQAMCFAVARSMRDAPTPEVVAALTAAAAATRHAGVRKKLARYATAARRNLVRRPDVALRLPAGKPTRAQVTAWTRTLETCWTIDPSWPAATWQGLVHGAPATSEVAAALVWTAPGAGSFRGTPGALVDVEGAPVALPPDARVRLWHPAAATPAERDAWRAQVWRERLAQPFPQVFREHYAPGDDGFTGAVLDATQLVGVARAQGWTPGPDGLVRVAGGVQVTVETDMSLYPGVQGRARVLHVGVGPAVPAPPDAPLPAVPVSELLRSVDLLVSTSAVARDEGAAAGPPPWDRAAPAGVLALRRTVLGHVLGDLDAQDAARVRLDGRHVEVGSARVHLATARVTRDGDPVDVEPVTGHGLWAPAADPLLTQVVGLVVALLRAG